MPRKHRAPAPETPNHVTGSRKEQVLFFVTVAVTTVVLLVVLFFAFAG